MWYSHCSLATHHRSWVLQESHRKSLAGFSQTAERCVELAILKQSPVWRLCTYAPHGTKRPVALNAVGSRVLRALEMTMSEPKYMQTLIKQYGLCLEEVIVTCLLQDLPNMQHSGLQVMRLNFAGENVTRHAGCICPVECSP